MTRDTGTTCQLRRYANCTSGNMFETAACVVAWLFVSVSLLVRMFWCERVVRKLRMHDVHYFAKTDIR